MSSNAHIYHAVLELSEQVRTLAVVINRRFDQMSTNEAQVQADLDSLTQTVNTLIPATIQLINDLAAQAANGQPLPAGIENDITAIKAKLASLQQSVNDTPDPGQPISSTTPTTVAVADPGVPGGGATISQPVNTAAPVSPTTPSPDVSDTGDAPLATKHPAK
jgi:hypothetical protein